MARLLDRASSVFTALFLAMAVLGAVGLRDSIVRADPPQPPEDCTACDTLCGSGFNACTYADCAPNQECYCSCVGSYWPPCLELSGGFSFACQL